MQIILLENISNLGRFGEKVNVAAGYARNFLLPKKKAVLATKENIKSFSIRFSEMESKLAEALKTARNRAEKIHMLNCVVIVSKSGNKGKLFGSIGARDIAYAVTKAGVDVDKKEVRLPYGALRTVGEHTVNFQFHNEVYAQLTVKITDSVSNNKKI